MRHADNYTVGLSISEERITEKEKRDDVVGKG